MEDLEENSRVRIVEIQNPLSVISALRSKYEGWQEAPSNRLEYVKKRAERDSLLILEFVEEIDTISSPHDLKIDIEEWGFKRPKSCKSGYPKKKSQTYTYVSYPIFSRDRKYAMIISGDNSISWYGSSLQFLLMFEGNRWGRAISRFEIY